MLQPTLEEVQRHVGEDTIVPVWRELLADLDTPVSAYVKLGCGPGSVLLESVEGGERLGRYSFVGVRPTSTLTLAEGEASLRGELGDRDVPFTDPLELLDGLLSRDRCVPVPNLPSFHGGAVGYLSYDLARYFERLPEPRGEGLGLPLGRLAWYKTILAFDHLRRTVKLIGHVQTRGDVAGNYARTEAELEALAQQLNAPVRQPIPASRPVAGGAVASATPVRSFNFRKDHFEDAVRAAKEYIAAGDALQVVLSQRISLPTGASPLAIYRALRAINPSPYMYLLDYGDFQVIGASPEMLVRVEEGVVSVHPIAGTKRRGSTPAEDARLAAELLADEKERAEHHMLVDLGRNDVGRVCEAGSVRVTQMLEVERYSHVMHMVSHVEGKLSENLRPVDALRAGFPAGTVSGAPKIRAMEIISELEPDARGPYAGAVGYFGFDGNLDTAITIRTIVLKDGVAHVQVGAGIVADSLPENEYEETLHKAAATLSAVQAAEAMDDTADR